jgi:hypothetical protein
MGLSHLANDAIYQAALEALPAVQVSVAGTRVKGFAAHILARSLELTP